MEFLSFWAAASVRSIGLAAVAWIGLGAARVKSPAAHHAVWSLMTAAMLAIVLGSAMLPSLPIRVLRPRVPAAPFAIPSLALQTPEPIPSPAPSRPFLWAVVYGAGLLLFGGRLLYGYAATCRLVRDSRRVPAVDGIYASERVAVPLTVGWLRPKILLPADWERWEPEKLDAVLVHERTHVGRADWAIAVLAGVNRCVFWFHPLAWWLDARVRVLAEQACDDASVPQVASREGYAQVLVEMAAAVKTGKGRVSWEAMAMARVADVRIRVERILDDSRPLFPAMTRRRWVTMALCAVPVVYVVAVARPARVRAEMPGQEPAPQATSVSRVTAKPQEQVTPGNAESDAARAELARIEAEVVKFKSENMGRLPEQFQVNVTALQSLQVQLGAANEALSRLRQDNALLATRLQNLHTQRGYYESQSSGESSRLEQLRQRTEELRGQLETAGEVYTENSPVLRSLRAKLSAVERDLQTTASAEPDRKTMLDLDGAISMTRTQIRGVNLSMDEKLKQVAQLSQTIAQYQQRIENSPRMEAQFGELLNKLARAQEQVDQLANQPSGPRLISRTEPEYTLEARKTRLEGKVELAITIDPDGRPTEFQVTRGLGSGLDEMAIECVKNWRFRPALRNGQPVTAFASVEVVFRLQ